MPFQQLTSNVLVGHMSAQQLSLALNSYGVQFLTNATAVLSLGSVKAKHRDKKLRVIARSTGVLGAAETLALVLTYITPAGVKVDETLTTLTLSNITGAGEFELSDALIAEVPVGSVLSLTATYTAGTPNDPAIGLTFELY